jgi:hypothetical protein
VFVDADAHRPAYPLLTERDMPRDPFDYRVTDDHESGGDVLYERYDRLPDSHFDPPDDGPDDEVVLTESDARVVGFRTYNTPRQPSPGDEIPHAYDVSFDRYDSKIFNRARPGRYPLVDLWGKPI